MSSVNTSLLRVWHGMEQSLINDAVDQSLTRLHACVHASGQQSNILCYYQCVFSVVGEFCFTPCVMLRVILSGRITEV